MAAAASLCACSLRIHSSVKPYKVTRSAYFSIRCRSNGRSYPRSSPSRDDSSVVTSTQESSRHEHHQVKPLISNEVIEPPELDTHPDPDPGPSARPSPSNSFSQFLVGLRDGYRVDGIGSEILSIALPAALALAADPLASLVDTAFVGHLGSAELAAVGVSVSVFNLVSKLFNVPLLNVTTSFVAEEQAIASKEDNGSGVKRLLPSVSTSLALAASVGIAEAFALSLGSGLLMNIMGIPVDSPMRTPAEQFLTLRAFGAPPIVIALAAQGTFRGFKDTKTPLYAIGAGNLLNVILDPVLIFLLDFGISGAAVATVISEYLTAFILLWKLNDNVVLLSPQIETGRVNQYIKSGGLLLGRTVALLVPFTLATSLAAQKGPIQMAGHQICLEVWLAISLLTDALAIAGQQNIWEPKKVYPYDPKSFSLKLQKSILAVNYSQGDYKQAQKVTFAVLRIGFVTGTGLAIFLFLGFESFSSLFTTDPEVLKIAQSGTLFVAGSQPVNALAFVVDGLYYGVSDFGYAAYSMVIVGLMSSAFFLVVAPVFGLGGVWMGLFLFMALRLAAGFWRLGTRSGPWKMLWSDVETLD